MTGARTLYHGDNLDFLRAIPDESVNLAATDPPFNKDRNFTGKSGAFTDRWEWDWKSDSGLSEIGRLNLNARQVVTTAKSVHGESTGAYLCWLALRLLEMHRVLAPTGSLYLHIDHTAQAWVKCLLDAVFGGENYRSEIIWRRHAHTHSLGARQWPVVHDSILMYSKGKSWCWNEQYEPHNGKYIEDQFRYSDDHGVYSSVPMTGNRPAGKEAYLPWRGIAPSSSNGAWALPRYSKLPEREGMPLTEGEWKVLSIHEKLDVLDNVGLIHWPKKEGGKPRLKRHLEDSPGKIMDGLWTDVGTSAGASEKTGYPTQKPLALYDRIIKASSNEGDVVLDPFAGSGTTLIATERLRRQWIGMDLWPDDSLRVILHRLTEEGVSIADVNYVSKPSPAVEVLP